MENFKRQQKDSKEFEERNWEVGQGALLFMLSFPRTFYWVQFFIKVSSMCAAL